MTTTVIFAELLIIGLQASVWIVFVFIDFFGTKWININELKGWESLLTVFILAVAYTLGILIDRTADSVFHSIDVKLRKKYICNEVLSVPKMRIQIMSESDAVAKFLDYIRSRLRIARSTSLNLFLITVSGVVLLAKQPGVKSNNVFATILPVSIVGIALVIFIGFIWARITKTYYKRLDQAYKMLFEKKSEDTDKK